MTCVLQIIRMCTHNLKRTTTQLTGALVIEEGANPYAPAGRRRSEA